MLLSILFLRKYLFAKASDPPMFTYYAAHKLFELLSPLPHRFSPAATSFHILSACGFRPCVVNNSQKLPGCAGCKSCERAAPVVSALKGRYQQSGPGRFPEFAAEPASTSADCWRAGWQDGWRSHAAATSWNWEQSAARKIQNGGEKIGKLSGGAKSM